ncbi:dTDP-4-amino-4,6-dideoxygalactose transaminase [Paenibacillus sp. JGP012]|nr:dTDP-4-amino-4,6-dideoxygalactose transaminase [Paenibacillus sp. JGP012]
MNTDFTPPNNIKYVLYPSEYQYDSLCYSGMSNLKGNRNEVFSRLRDRIATVFDIRNPSQVYLFDSASSAITALLTILKNQHNIECVYMPSYSCTELADSVISAGLTLNVYDITDDFRPELEFVRSLIGVQQAAFLIPALFGSRSIPSELMDVLHQLKMPVIFDEAQSFPMAPQFRGTTPGAFFSVISFGKSKPLSSIGGGALIVHQPEMNTMFTTYSEDALQHQEPWFPYLRAVTRRQLSKYSWWRKVNGLQYRYADLAALHRAQQIRQRKPRGITLLQAQMALRRLQFFLKQMERQKVHVPGLLDALESTFGKQTLRFVLARDQQCLLPIRIPNHKRKKIGAYLAQKGVQTTFYYYPLHNIERYKERFQLHDCFNADRIFSEILLLPIHTDTPPRHIKKLERFIRQYDEYSTDT